MEDGTPRAFDVIENLKNYPCGATRDEGPSELAAIEDKGQEIRIGRGNTPVPDDARNRGRVRERLLPCGRAEGE